MDYFISDSHFGHKNIIKYCSRPFENVVEMNNEMINRWNSVVKETDRIFVVGDMFLCDEDSATKIMSQLKGYKVLIAGNHDDRKSVMLRIGFKEYHRELSYSLRDKLTILLKHYPHPDKVTLGAGYERLMHGHIHNPPHLDGLKINVAADLINFTPVSEDYVFRCLSDSSANDQNEKIDISVDDKKIKLSIEIRAEDFSGTVDHIYSVLRAHWREDTK